MKYHSRKTTIDGITFDSRKEAQRYVELKTLETAGRISHLVLQPEFVLIPSFKKNGKTFRKTVYRADFSYLDKDGKYIVEDVKSPITAKEPTYRLKKKLFEYTYPELTIKEVI